MHTLLRKTYKYGEWQQAAHGVCGRQAILGAVVLLELCYSKRLCSSFYSSTTTTTTTNTTTTTSTTTIITIIITTNSEFARRSRQPKYVLDVLTHRQ